MVEKSPMVQLEMPWFPLHCVMTNILSNYAELGLGNLKKELNQEFTELCVLYWEEIITKNTSLCFVLLMFLPQTLVQILRDY